MKITEEVFWKVCTYEVQMYKSFRRLYRDRPVLNTLSLTIRNSLIENFMMRIFNLSEIFLDRGNKNKLKLEQVLPNEKRDASIVSRLEHLDVRWGIKSQKDSPCWILHKMIFSANKHRSSSYCYEDIIDDICPILDDIIIEVEVSLGKIPEMNQ